jgi:hypothetical protein
LLREQQAKWHNTGQTWLAFQGAGSAAVNANGCQTMQNLVYNLLSKENRAIFFLPFNNQPMCP